MLRAGIQIFAPAALRAAVALRATALRAVAALRAFFLVKKHFFFEKIEKIDFLSLVGSIFWSVRLQRTYIQTLIPRLRRGLTLIPPTV